MVQISGNKEEEHAQYKKLYRAQCTVSLHIGYIWRKKTSV